jgi:hypothetical protein
MSPPFIPVGFDGNPAAEALPLQNGSDTCQGYPVQPAPGGELPFPSISGLQLRLRADLGVTDAGGGKCSQWVVIGHSDPEDLRPEVRAQETS